MLLRNKIPQHHFCLLLPFRNHAAKNKLNIVIHDLCLLHNENRLETIKSAVQGTGKQTRSQN